MLKLRQAERAALIGAGILRPLNLPLSSSVSFMALCGGWHDGDADSTPVAADLVSSSSYRARGAQVQLVVDRDDVALYGFWLAPVNEDA